MRTKHIVVIIVVAASLGIALALWMRSGRAPAENDAAPTEEAAAESASLEPIELESVFDADDLAPLEVSPQGLYDDLDAASERAGEKPAITLERVPPPALAPPQRAPDDEENAPDPA